MNKPNNKSWLVWLRYLALLMALIALLANIDIIGQTGAGSEVDGNIFTFDYLLIDEEEYQEGTEIDLTDEPTIKLGYTWELIMPHEVMDGDFATIKVPDVFEALTDITGRIIVDDSGHDLDVGEYTLVKDTNILRFIFNENIEGLDVIEGFIWFELDFELEEFTTSTVQLVPFEDLVDTKLTIILKPTTKASAIDKIGVPNAALDPSFITWTIDVLNTGGEETPQTITEATVIDNIPAGLTLVEGSIQTVELFQGYNGEKTTGEPVAISPVIAGDGFEITFQDLIPYSGYRITFETTFTDFETLTFTNEAFFEYNETSLRAEATVDGFSRSDIVEKSGTSPNQNEIKWTIDINKSGNNISEAILDDLLPEGDGFYLEIREGSIKFYELTQEVGGNWVIDGAEIPYSDIVGGAPDPPEEFPINLGAITENEAYRITFITDIEYTGDYQRDNSFTNTAILNDGDTFLGEDTATVNITRDPILRKTSASNLTYDEKIINWTIYVNEVNHPLNDVVVTDEIPAGLNLDVNSVKVLDENNADVTSGFAGAINYDEGTRTLTVDLGDIGTASYTIEYVTEITDFTEGRSFVNSAGLTGDGVDGEETTTSTTTPADNSYTKNFFSIDYEAKTIDWRIRVNPIKEPITSLKITDTFPNKGLFLDDGSVNVELGGTPLTLDTDYTLVPAEVDEVTGYQKGFVLEFDSNVLPLNNLIIIDFTTFFDPDTPDIEPNTQDGLMTNKAHFEGETQSDITIDEESTASYTLRDEAWFSGKKEGRKVHDDGEDIIGGWVSGQDREIEWNLYINYLDQELGDDVSIQDSWGYVGNYVEGSLEVREYEVNAAGDITITDTVLSNDLYTFTSNDTDPQGWSLNFGTYEVNNRYVITFRPLLLNSCANLAGN